MSIKIEVKVLIIIYICSERYKPSFMKRLSLICASIIVVLGMSACKDTNTDSNIGLSAEELALLQSENRVLKDQLAEKDSVLNESILLFNEI